MHPHEPPAARMPLISGKESGVNLNWVCVSWVNSADACAHTEPPVVVPTALVDGMGEPPQGSRLLRKLYFMKFLRPQNTYILTYIYN